MTKTATKRPFDALRACEAIAEFVAEKEFSDYESNNLLRSAVERQFEIIGEALNKAASLDPSLVDCLPELNRIVGLRNRLIHGYDNVDDEILWDVVQSKLGPLAARISAVLAEGDSAG
jgi:uncharacterized protein with HEPN domain